jgi:hypothetical protein
MAGNFLCQHLWKKIETVKHTPSVLTYKVGSIYNRKGILSNQVWYQTCMTSTQVWYSKLNRVKTSLIFNVYNVNTSLIYTCNIVALYQHHSDIQRLYRQYKSDNSTFDGMYCSVLQNIDGGNFPLPTFMKKKLKQWWSTIQTILTKRTTTYRLNLKKKKVFTLLLWQRQHIIVVDAVDYK